MDQTQFNAAIEKIVSALKAAGYDPFVQLKGYVDTGESTFITRRDGARDLITELSIDDIKDFLKAYNIK